MNKLDLESIGSSLGIDLELIWSGVKWRGPAIIPGLDNRHLIIEGHSGQIGVMPICLNGRFFGDTLYTCTSVLFYFNTSEKNFCCKIDYFYSTYN